MNDLDRRCRMLSRFLLGASVGTVTAIVTFEAYVEGMIR